MHGSSLSTFQDTLHCAVLMVTKRPASQKSNAEMERAPAFAVRMYVQATGIS